jgi:hypothetical protein
MISAFTGSTTDPVIRKRITSVLPVRRTSPRGSESPREDCWSRNAAVAPVTWTGNPTGVRRTCSTRRFADDERASASGTTSIRQ